MPGRKSKTRLSKSEAREAFVEEAGRLWDRFTAWYGAHPEATFDDIDPETGELGHAPKRQIRALYGKRAGLSIDVQPDGPCSCLLPNTGGRPQETAPLLQFAHGPRPSRSPASGHERHATLSPTDRRGWSCSAGCGRLQGCRRSRPWSARRHRTARSRTGWS
jgi:hypothetical protein